MVSGVPLRGLPFQADQFSFKLVRLDGRISMWMVLALLAGAALAAYGFFVGAMKNSRARNLTPP